MFPTFSFFWLHKYPLSGVILPYLRHCWTPNVNTSPIRDSNLDLACCGGLNVGINPVGSHSPFPKIEHPTKVLKNNTQPCFWPKCQGFLSVHDHNSNCNCGHINCILCHFPFSIFGFPRESTFESNSIQSTKCMFDLKL